MRQNEVDIWTEFPQALEALRAIAQRIWHGNGTLSPTAVVNEAFLKLAAAETDFASRDHFIAVATKTLRHVVVEHARCRQRLKRGGGCLRIDLDVDGLTDDAGPRRELDPETVLSLDAALSKLQSFDPRAAALVELRFFAGLTEEQAALHLDVARRTVQKDWAFARAWLSRELGPEFTW